MPHSRVARPGARGHSPAPRAPGAAAFPGVEILEEVNGPLGLLLWQVHRDLHLLLGLAPEERRATLAPGAARQLRALLAAGEDAELAGAVEPLLEGGAVPPGACRRIAAWAASRGRFATAAAYAAAEALVARGLPGAALHPGGAA